MGGVTAIFLTAGTTPEPLIKCLDEAYTQEKNVVAYIIYGTPFPDQTPDPLTSAIQVKKRAEDLGFKTVVRGAPDPEDFMSCQKTFESALKDSLNYDVEQIIINYTGGTKPMAAALVHTALTQLTDVKTVTLDYVGGIERDEKGRVKGRMRSIKHVKPFIDEKMRRTIELARHYSFPQALSLLGGTELIGKSKFIRDSLEALNHWDHFRYEEAHGAILDLKKQAEVLIEDDPTHIPDTIINLSKTSGRISNLVKHLRKLEDGRDETLRPFSSDPEGLALLSLDAYNNAERRKYEGRWIDAVLRAYRSIEVAVQSVLISKHSINPWHPDWNKLDERTILDSLAKLNIKHMPEQISLYAGYSLIEALDGELGARDELQKLMTMRNHSYLEHGFQRVSKKGSESSLVHSKRILESVLGLIEIESNKLEEIAEKTKIRI